jgi:hypothetical protein
MPNFPIDYEAAQNLRGYLLKRIDSMERKLEDDLFEECLILERALQAEMVKPDRNEEDIAFARGVKREMFAELGIPLTAKLDSVE